METGYRQPYVEDFDSVVGEVVPLTARRQTTRKSSSLAQCSTASYEAPSDSGYSSQSVSSTPITETPPPQKERPTPAPEPDREASPSPAHGTIRSQSRTTRPSSKSFSRSNTPAVPRNIPNSNGKNIREDSPPSSTGGSSDCDCPDCKTTSKPSPNSPSILTGAWPLHSYSSSYGHSNQWPGYPYSRYEGYSNSTDSGVSDLSRGSGSIESGSGSKRASMPPPPRPQSSFAGSSSHAPSNSWSSGGYGGSYFTPSHSSSPVPPAPSLTTPPYASSMYPPPPLTTAPPAPSPQPTHSSSSSYAPPPLPNYGYVYPQDYYGSSPASNPEPPYPTAADYALPSSSSNRRHSMRAQANAGAAVQDVPIEYSHSLPHHPQRRLSNRVHGVSERPGSWYHGQPQYHEVPNRSVSVPPVDSNQVPITESRRRMATPQPIRSRRDSANTREREHSARLGPSSLSRSMESSSLARAMESCAIADDSSPGRSSHHYSHRHYDSYGTVARRDPGTLYPYRREESEPKEELVSLTVVDSDEPFTMTYPAGVKLQVNGAYKHVQQRQQQVHAQLAGQYEYDRRANEEYYHRSSTRRESMNGY